MGAFFMEHFNALSFHIGLYFKIFFVQTRKLLSTSLCHSLVPHTCGELLLCYVINSGIF